MGVNLTAPENMRENPTAPEKHGSEPNCSLKT
jgi:hypothetical protein